MALTKKLDYERARELFVCDPGPACIYWRVTKEPAGKRVKWSTSTRVVIRVDGRIYLQDDIIWLLKYHSWPDHGNDDTTTASTKEPRGRRERGVTVEVKYCPKSRMHRVYTKKNGVVVSSSTYLNEEAARKSVEKRGRGKVTKPKSTAFLYRKVELACEDSKGWRALVRKGDKITSNKAVNVLLYPTEESRQQYARDLQQRYRMEDEDAFFVIYKMERISK